MPDTVMKSIRKARLNTPPKNEDPHNRANQRGDTLHSTAFGNMSIAS
jgi:hypothetical protein